MHACRRHGRATLPQQTLHFSTSLHPARCLSPVPPGRRKTMSAQLSPYTDTGHHRVPGSPRGSPSAGPVQAAEAHAPGRAMYSFCDFTKETGLYAILFSRPGSYQKLLSLPVPPQQFLPYGHAFRPCLSVSCCVSWCSVTCLSLSGKNKLCSWFLPRPFFCPLPGLPFSPCSQKNCVF